MNVHLAQYFNAFYTTGLFLTLWEHQKTSGERYKNMDIGEYRS